MIAAMVWVFLAVYAAGMVCGRIAGRRRRLLAAV
jgi:hypothetical protein